MNRALRKEQLGERVRILNGFAFASFSFSISKGLPLIRIRDLGSSLTEVRFDGVYDKRYLVADGEILVGMDGDFNAVRWRGGTALLNQRVCKIESVNRNLHSGFLFHSLQGNLDLIHQRTAETTVRHLSTKDVKRIEIPSLSFAEQRAIAEILDTADESIRSTERIIAKLEQAKQGLLHDLLTYGVGRSGHLRKPDRHPSDFMATGIGQIPVTWNCREIGSLATVKRGASPRPIDDPHWFADEGPGWVRISDVTASRKYLRTTTQRLSPEGAARSVPVTRGQVIMSIAATVGEAIIVDMDACIHDGFVLVDHDPKAVSPEFLSILLNSRKGWFTSQGQPGTQVNINSKIVRRTLVGVPPINEQTEITRILEAHDVRLELASRSLRKLRLLKHGLMGDLLTGRVRVVGTW